MKTKTKTKRHLLLLLLCGWVSTGQATDVINEDFSSFGSINYGTISHNGWTLNKCYSRSGRSSGYDAIELKYVTGVQNTYASAESPAFSTLPENRNAILTFYYAQGASNKSTKISVTLNHQGTIREVGSAEMATNNKITITTSSTTFTEKTCYIYGANTASTLTFKSADDSGNTGAIDDVVVTIADQTSLSESATNTVDAAKVADVTLTRTLTGGIWNTLCLPFNIDMTTLSLALGEGQDIQLRTFSSYADGIINFTSANSINAGTPFLIKLNTTVENPTFPVVNLETTAAQTVTNGDVSMVGVYSPYVLPENGVFLSTDGKLKKPSGSREMKGLRAFFTIPSNQQQNARIFIDNSTSGITETETAAPDDDDWHSLSGIRLSGKPVTKGIYIYNGKKMILK